MRRPIRNFHGFVGQSDIVARLARQIKGAQVRAEPSPHTLLCGPSGIGKTTLARAYAAEAKANFKKTYGKSTPEELTAMLRTVEPGDVLLIDEAHRLPTNAQEFLCEVIDERGFSISGDRDSEHQFVPVVCTLLLVTDQPGAFVNALNNRLPLREKLTYYSNREMRVIIDQLASSQDLLLKAQAANFLANVSCGLPRYAVHLLENLRRHYGDAGDRELTLPEIRAYLDEFGIDESGLGPNEREYLQYLHENSRASLDSLAFVLGLDAAYVRRHVEPILMRDRLITIGPGGRQLTANGRQRILNPTRTGEPE